MTADNIDDATQGLSIDQALMLGRIIKLHEAYTEEGLRRHWGVRINIGGNASMRASGSRSLRRLEARGLILRQNGISGGLRTSDGDPHTRTRSVQLTELGIAYRDRLKGEQTNG